MKIDKYKKIGKDKYRIFLDNGEVLDTYDEVILKNDLLLKKDLDYITYNKIQEESQFYTYYNEAIKYISIRVRSTKEVMDYFNRKHVDRFLGEEIIDKLTENRYLDDENFVRCYICDKLKFTSWGPYKIIRELKKQDISSEMIDKHRNLLEEAIVYQKLEKLISKKLMMKSNQKYDKNKLRNKLYQAHLALGYSSEMIVEILNELL